MFLPLLDNIIFKFQQSCIYPLVVPSGRCEVQNCSKSKNQGSSLMDAEESSSRSTTSAGSPSFITGPGAVSLERFCAPETTPGSASFLAETFGEALSTIRT